MQIEEEGCIFEKHFRIVFFHGLFSAFVWFAAILD